MSYILDALKKSAMQARQGELPDIHSSHVLGSTQTHRPGWQYALFGGAAAAVLFGGFYLLMPADPASSQHAGAPLTDTQPAATQTTAMPMPTPNPVPAPAPATMLPGPPVTSPPQAAQSQAAAIPVPAAQPASTATPEPVSATATEAPQPASPPALEPPANQQPAPTGSAGAIPMPDIRPAPNAEATLPPLLSKLPVAVQESLPPIDISGHIYDARPASRMVFINGHIQREGDMLPQGLNLLSITPNGVTLSFRGTDFRIELFPMPAHTGK